MERKDRIQDTSTDTGTGTFDLAGVAPDGFLPFAGNITTGALVRYLIESEDQTEWEVGEGIFTDGSPDTLTRATIFSSSNSGVAVDFTAGNKTVSLVLTAKDIKERDFLVTQVFS